MWIRVIFCVCTEIYWLEIIIIIDVFSSKSLLQTDNLVKIDYFILFSFLNPCLFLNNSDIIKNFHNSKFLKILYN